MPSYKEWEKEAKKLSDAEALKIIDAIDTLHGWKYFDEQYRWTLMRSVRMIVMQMMDERHPVRST